MKRKKGWKKRTLGFTLALFMIATALPSSLIAYAAEGLANRQKADVSVKWEPASKQIRTGETTEIALSASFNKENEKGIESAEVKVRLSAEEAGTLEQFHNDQGALDENITLTSKEGVIISLQKSGDGSVYLCFALDQTHPTLTQTLSIATTAKTTAPFAIKITEEDIEISVKPGESQSANLEKQGGAIAVTASFAWEMDLEPNSSPLDITQSIPDFSFALSADSLNNTEMGTLYTKEQSFEAKLLLPEGIALPEGQYSYKADTQEIVCDQVVVAKVTGLPEDAQMMNVARNDDKTLVFEIQRTAAQAGVLELENLSCTLLFSGAALTKTEDMVLEKDTAISLGVAMEAVSVAGESYVSRKSITADVALVAQTATASPTPMPTPTPVQEYVKIDAYRDSYDQTVFWVDNNNEESVRPKTDAYPQPQLQFAIDGSTEFVTLTEENMHSLGLTQMPKAVVDQSGVGTYLVTYGNNVLPSKITHVDRYEDEDSHTIEWKIVPAEAESYALVEVTDENLDQHTSISETGWYYVLKTDFSFELCLRWGTLGQAPGIQNAILNQFNFIVSYGQTNIPYLLKDVQNIDVTFAPSEDPANPTRGTLTIQDAWKYNLDGSRISYSVEQREEGSGKIELPGVLDEGDYFAISYDNSAAPNFGSVTDKLHNGGTIYLTLTGKTDYQAAKVWLDENTEEAAAKRPTGEFQLWRYRSGESYTTAAPMRHPDGTIVSVELDPANHQQLIGFGDLEKYDPEGCKYIYVVREYLDTTNKTGETARNYEQVFGAVSQDGTVTDRVDKDGVLTDTTEERPAGNTYLYDAGTLSNRIQENITAETTKTWKAAAFQSEFEDIKIELTLQSRVEGSGDAWQNTTTKVTLEDFFAEKLTDSVKKSVSKYDALGRTLEYRWIESGVYQGENSKTNLLTPDENGGTFTLIQGETDRKIHYRSISEIQSDGSTRITNAIANQIDYDVEKVWRDKDGNDISAPEGAEVTFSIYRIINGGELQEPIATFRMDGQIDQEPTLVNAELGIYAKESGAWQATVTPLDEYDEAGRQYEYLILEVENNTQYLPTYETTRDDEGYETIVYNAPGEGNRIMVRKLWIDDGDILHREPVTVTVYERANNHVVGQVVLQDGVWHNWVGIGSLEPEDVYILETQVGNTQVPLTSYYIGSGQEPNFTAPEAPLEWTEENKGYTAIQFETDHHKYEATYAHERINGITLYNVTNRRLGNIDITGTKQWTDGDGEKRGEIQQELAKLKQEGRPLTLMLRLKFADGQIPDYYQITYLEQGGDTVTIGNPDNKVAILDGKGHAVSAMQPVSLETSSSAYEFFNLPKYDRNGTAVQYELEEVWVDKDGQIVEKESLKEEYAALYELTKEYNTVYTETNYTPEHHGHDIQDIKVENILVGTKAVLWHKQWKDDYIYHMGQRPDIYLDIYQVKHISQTETEVSLYQANYKWTYLSLDPSEDPDGLYDKQLHWHAELSGLPKYDSLGYEVEYYATEHATINTQNFDYMDVRYSVPESEGSYSQKNIGSEYDITDEGLAYVQNIQTAEEPHYALIEGGTFTNIIANTVTIQGQKLWTSVPASYPVVDLPTVAFTLYRQSGEGPREEAASLTVSDWASIYHNGSYIFRLEYEGINQITVDGEGNITITGEKDAAKLPKYDLEGRLYSYSLEETSVIWPNGDQTDTSEVYQQPVINTYLVDNTYNSIKGALSFKKYVRLPMDNGVPKAYPAVRFEVSRSYRTAQGAMSSPEIVSYLNWSSAEVKAAFEAAETGDALVEKTFMVENLDIYAPNGSQYVYTVKESKAYLGGYDTWAVAGDVIKDELVDAMRPENQTTIVEGIALTRNQEEGRGETADSIPICATFINAPQDNREKVGLEGTKVWEDANDEFGFRPNDLTLHLYRYADSQPGESNGIPQHEIQAEIHWTKEGNTWTYTIEDLERYAPNGMAWKYRVVEAVPDYYTPSPSTVNQKSTDKDGNITMNPLKNTIFTAVSYTKQWQDSSGNAIAEDYLGVDLTVNFGLQVRIKPLEEDTWSAWSATPENTLSALLGSEAYQTVFGQRVFETSVTGRIDDSIWSNKRYFGNLPRYAKATDGTIVMLDYRVLETAVQYGSATQTVTVTDQADGSYQYDMPVEGALFVVTGSNTHQSYTITNALKTTKLTVGKTWVNDSKNDYGTRPETGRSERDWESSFVIQQSIDGINWENVKVYGDHGSKQDLVVTLYGTNDQDYAALEIDSLPKANMDGRTLMYRAMELQPDYALEGGLVSEEAMLEEGDTYHDAYTVTYNEDHTAATNIMKGTEIYAKKGWNPSSAAKPVTLELQYKGKDGSWKSFSSPAKVTVDGKPDQQAASYYEYDAWKAVWKNVPEAMPGSDLTDEGKTQYRVVEAIPSGYIQQSCGEDTKDGYQEFAFINVESVDFHVEKKWYGMAEDQQQEVVVGLWRTTGDIGDDRSEAVMNEDGTQLTIPLNRDGQWKGSFTKLPKYDEEGNVYLYYAREMTIGGVSAEQVHCSIQYTDEQTMTSIANIGLTEVAGTKIWKDYHNEYQTRPETLQLTLFRSIEGGAEQIVSADPVWEMEGDVWHYRYADLPKTDGQGHPYSYRIEESVPDGYDLEQDGYQLTNRLCGTVDIPVTKIWRDQNNASGERPAKIELALYADGVEYKRAVVYKDTGLLEGQWDTMKPNTDNVWAYTFTDLPMYDSEGKLIEYTIEEVNVPDGYEARYEGTTIQNVKFGGISVRKTVSGTAGDPNQEFHFTVALENESIQGQYGDMQFVDGVASFTLKHGETIKAEGLPADLAYTVKEEEADQDGYLTKAEQEIGAVPAGGIAEVSFVNLKNLPPQPSTIPDGGMKTGDNMDQRPYQMGLAVSCLGVIATLYAKNRRTKRRKG